MVTAGSAVVHEIRYERVVMGETNCERGSRWWLGLTATSYALHTSVNFHFEQMFVT